MEYLVTVEDKDGKTVCEHHVDGKREARAKARNLRAEHSHRFGAVMTLSVPDQDVIDTWKCVRGKGWCPVAPAAASSRRAAPSAAADVALATPGGSPIPTVDDLIRIHCEFSMAAARIEGVIGVSLRRLETDYDGFRWAQDVKVGRKYVNVLDPSGKVVIRFYARKIVYVGEHALVAKSDAVLPLRRALEVRGGAAGAP